MIEKYLGITYPRLFWWEWQYALWRRVMCKRNMHVFDEVLSGGSPWEHSLVCDACQLVIHIESIDRKYQPEWIKKACDKARGFDELENADV